MDKHLHIVSLDVPYPVSYGGAAEIFYKLVALHGAGIRIHLHCFENGQDEQPLLNSYCEEVHYYPRHTGHKAFSLELPYIVTSRRSDRLIERLLADKYPILLEGIHCTSLLQNELFADRKVILRLHNIEHKYYRQLYHSSGSIFKKLYYLHESILLKKYEPIISRKTSLIIALAEQDVAGYRTEFNIQHIVHLPVFTGFKRVSGNKGIGCYCLYHGNLSVPENEKAAAWLIKKVFNDLSIPLLIAGKNPSRRLARIAGRYAHVSLMANPSEQDMQDIISKAQINIIPSFNCTGVKLKLLNVLYNGRHCIVNNATVESTGLDAACHIAGNAAGFKSIVMQLYNRPFEEEETDLRKQLLNAGFDDKKNARRLIEWIW